MGRDELIEMGRKINSPAEIKYFQYLKGKSVVVIGPAGYYQEPDELPFDVVVRVNGCYKTDRRTDVIYLSVRHLPGHIKGFGMSKEWVDVYRNTWVILKTPPSTIKRPVHDNTRKIIDGFDKWVPMNAAVKKSIVDRAGSPSGATFAIGHLLASGLSRLETRGIDFFQSGYIEGYSEAWDTYESVEELKSHCYRGGGKWEHHDWDRQVKYFKKLIAEDKRFQPDQRLSAILEKWQDSTD